MSARFLILRSQVRILPGAPSLSYHILLLTTLKQHLVWPETHCRLTIRYAMPRLAAFADEYLTKHAEQKKAPGSVAGDRQNLTNHILPALGRRKVSDITRADVAKFHAGTRSATAVSGQRLSSNDRSRHQPWTVPVATTARQECAIRLHERAPHRPASN